MTNPSSEPPTPVDTLAPSPEAGREVLARLRVLTPREARRMTIRHADAFSEGRRDARARARAVAREHHLIEDMDALIREVRPSIDLTLVPDRSRDTLLQVATDAMVAAVLDGALDEETRRTLARPFERATRRR